MPERDPLPEHLEGASRSFESFLKSIKLLPHDAPRRTAADGRYHGRLSAGDGVSLTEPYRIELQADQPPHWFILSWEHEEALDAWSEAVKRVGYFCPGISTSAVEGKLTSLVVSFIEEGRLSEEVLAEFQMTEDDDAGRRHEGVHIEPYFDLPSLREPLHQLVMSLRQHAHPSIAYVPIEGLEVSSPITIGQVTIEAREADGEFEQVLEVMQERPRTRIIESIRADVIPEARVACYAKLEIKGDQQYVVEEAVKQVSNALNVLSLCLPSHMHRHSWAKMSVVRNLIVVRVRPSDVLEDDYIAFTWSNPSGHDKDLRWTNLVDVIGARSTPRFASKPVWKRNPEQEDATVQQTLDGLFETFASGNEISQSIARALTWYGKAMGFTDPSEQFVALAIALDSLLGRRGSGTDVSRASALSITQTISERVAFLLGENYEDRTKRYDDTTRLYGLRSKIVHEGLTAAEEDVFELEELLKDVILVFNAQGFTSWQRVQEWVMERVFTTDPNDAAAEGEE